MHRMPRYTPPGNLKRIESNQSFCTASAPLLVGCLDRSFCFAALRCDRCVPSRSWAVARLPPRCGCFLPHTARTVRVRSTTQRHHSIHAGASERIENGCETTTRRGVLLVFGTNRIESNPIESNPIESNPIESNRIESPKQTIGGSIRFIERTMACNFRLPYRITNKQTNKDDSFIHSSLFGLLFE